jgi:hypothetical protein
MYYADQRISQNKKRDKLSGESLNFYSNFLAEIEESCGIIHSSMKPPDLYTFYVMPTY